MNTKMVKCFVCGAMAIPELMWSVIDDEEKPAWICDDCYGTRIKISDVLGDESGGAVHEEV